MFTVYICVCVCVEVCAMVHVLVQRLQGVLESWPQQQHTRQQQQQRALDRESPIVIIRILDDWRPFFTPSHPNTVKALRKQTRMLIRNYFLLSNGLLCDDVDE